MAKVKRPKSDMSKLERITEAKGKLGRQFSKLDVRTKKAAESLFENAAFMIITLEDLQKTINENGVISEYQNGENQWGTKKSPEVEIYNTMVKNHMSIMKQLTDLLPEAPPIPKDDGFDDFVGNR